MNGVRILVDFTDATQGIAAIAARVERKRDVMARIGAALLVSTQNRFEREAGPDGNPWPASIRAKVEGGKTLRDEGLLFGSLTFNATDDAVEVGTNSVKAAIHQFGGRIEAKSADHLRFKIGGTWVTKDFVDMPARPFLGIDTEDETEIRAIMGDWLQEAIAEARP